MAKKNTKEQDNTELFDKGIDRVSRTIILNGEVNEDLLFNLECGLTLLEGLSNDEINIRLNTPGGSVFAGNSMVDRILSSTCPIHIHAYGEISSMGIFILASGDTRSSSSLTAFLHHEDSYEVDGRHSHNKNYIKFAERQDMVMCKWLSTRTKKDMTFWKKTGVEVDHWFTADQALEYGLIHEIIN